MISKTNPRRTIEEVAVRSDPGPDDYLPNIERPKIGPGLAEQRRELGTALVPLGRGLVDAADAQHPGLVVAAADDLQRDRQAARGEAICRRCRQRE